MYRYLSDNDRFADLFNAVFFGGKKVPQGEQLEPDGERYADSVCRKEPELSPGSGSMPCAKGPVEDAETSGNRKGSPAKPGKSHKLPEYEKGFRDIKKRLRTGESFVVTAVESQEAIDYAMPWRIMRYDQMEYGRQLDEIKREKRKKRQAAGLPRSSWTERMAKDDCLHPVYTICFYHGTQEWDGPRSLRDMMEFPEGEDSLWKEYFHDYGMTLFCADEPGDLERFGTGLKQLLEVLRLRQDKEALLRLWEQEEFSHIDRDTAETIAVLTDSVEILDKLEDYENKEGGGYSMCLAVDEMRKEWKAEGIAEGIIETGLDFGLSESAILERLQQKMQISLEKAQEYFAMYSVQIV